jgi:hypothetical protein
MAVQDVASVSDGLMWFYERRVGRWLRVQEALMGFEAPAGVDPARWRQSVASQVVMAIEEADGETPEMAARLARS